MALVIGALFVCCLFLATMLFALNALSKEQAEQIEWLQAQYDRLKDENCALIEAIGNANRTPVKFDRKQEPPKAVGGFYDKVPLGEGNLVPEARVLRAHP